jgi:uncharacterized protein HemX
MVSILLAVILAVILAVVVFLVMLFQGRERSTRLNLLRQENERLLSFQGENERLRTDNAVLVQRIEAGQSKTQWIETAKAKLREAFNSLAADALKGNSQFVEW